MRDKLQKINGEDFTSCAWVSCWK